MKDVHNGGESSDVVCFGRSSTEQERAGKAGGDFFLGVTRMDGRSGMSQSEGQNMSEMFLEIKPEMVWTSPGKEEWIFW